MPNREDLSNPNPAITIAAPSAVLIAISSCCARHRASVRRMKAAVACATGSPGVINRTKARPTRTGVHEGSCGGLVAGLGHSKVDKPINIGITPRDCNRSAVPRRILAARRFRFMAAGSSFLSPRAVYHTISGSLFSCLTAKSTSNDCRSTNQCLSLWCRKSFAFDESVDLIDECAILTTRASYVPIAQAVFSGVVVSLSGLDPGCRSSHPS